MFSDFSIVEIAITLLGAFILIPKAIIYETRTISSLKIKALCNSYNDLLCDTPNMHSEIIARTIDKTLIGSPVYSIMRSMNGIKFYIDIASKIMEEAKLLDDSKYLEVEKSVKRLVGDTAYRYHQFNIDPSLFVGQYHEGSFSVLKHDPAKNSFTVSSIANHVSDLQEILSVIYRTRFPTLDRVIAFSSRNLDRR